MKLPKTVLVTGCSSGIGLQTALKLGREGIKVFATMRNPDNAKKLRQFIEEESLPISIYPLDITASDDEIKAIINQIVSEHNHIDAVVNNAGITIDAFFEDHSREDVEKIFKTNVFGAMNVCRAVLPHMRTNGYGRIINIGSIAGRWALPQIGVYSATKFAIEGFTEALRREVAPFGVTASIIEPCFVNTEMVTVNRNIGQYSNSNSSSYNHMNEISEEFYESYGTKYEVEPDVIANKVFEVITAKKPKIRYIVGKLEKYINLMMRFLPESIFQKLLNNYLPKF